MKAVNEQKMHNILYQFNYVNIIYNNIIYQLRFMQLCN